MLSPQRGRQSVWHGHVCLGPLRIWSPACMQLDGEIFFFFVFPNPALVHVGGFFPRCPHTKGRAAQKLAVFLGYGVNKNRFRFEKEGGLWDGWGGWVGGVVVEKRRWHGHVQNFPWGRKATAWTCCGPRPFYEFPLPSPIVHSCSGNPSSPPERKGVGWHRRSCGLDYSGVGEKKG